MGYRLGLELELGLGLGLGLGVGVESGVNVRVTVGFRLGLGAVSAGAGKRGVGHGALMLPQAPLRLLWLAVLLTLFRPEPKGRRRASNLMVVEAVVVGAAVTWQSVARASDMGGIAILCVPWYKETNMFLDSTRRFYTRVATESVIRNTLWVSGSGTTAPVQNRV